MSLLVKLDVKLPRNWSSVIVIFLLFVHHSDIVTERKHRMTKKIALHVFRSIDNVVVNGMLNRLCLAITDPSSSLFREKYQVDARRVVLNGCGSLHGAPRWSAGSTPEVKACAAA